MLRTGLVYHTNYLRHETGEHPEVRERLGVILDSLEKYKMLDSLVPIEPREATVAEIQTVHTPAYVKRIEEFSAKGGGHWDEETVLAQSSYHTALWAAGGVMAAVDSVMTNEVDNAFALVRPPGHHATKEMAMGFCIFNNIAIATKYAQAKYNLERIMIVDIDAHHGDGIQEAFYEDPGVLYFSVHQDGIFPYKGWATEVGGGAGEGYNINVPVPKDTGDSGFYYIFNQLFEPIALQYKPQLIMVACGVDGHFYDYLSNLENTTPGYAMIMEKIKSVADQTCNGKIVAALEGGYNLEALGTSIAAIINVMGNFGQQIKDSIIPPANIFKPQARLRIDDAIDIQKKYWNL